MTTIYLQNNVMEIILAIKIQKIHPKVECKITRLQQQDVDPDPSILDLYILYRMSFADARKKAAVLEPCMVALSMARLGSSADILWSVLLEKLYT